MNSLTRAAIALLMLTAATTALLTGCRSVKGPIPAVEKELFQERDGVESGIGWYFAAFNVGEVPRDIRFDGEHTAEAYNGSEGSEMGLWGSEEHVPDGVPVRRFVIDVPNDNWWMQKYKDYLEGWKAGQGISAAVGDVTPADALIKIGSVYSHIRFLKSPRVVGKIKDSEGNTVVKLQVRQREDWTLVRKTDRANQEADDLRLSDVNDRSIALQSQAAQKLAFEEATYREIAAKGEALVLQGKETQKAKEAAEQYLRGLPNQKVQQQAVDAERVASGLAPMEKASLDKAKEMLLEKAEEAKAAEEAAKQAAAEEAAAKAKAAAEEAAKQAAEEAAAEEARQAGLPGKGSGPSAGKTGIGMENHPMEIPVLLPPGIPSALHAETAEASGIALSWTDNSSNETGFMIERMIEFPRKGISQFMELARVGEGATRYEDNDVFAGNTYHYRICAFNAAGDSAFSNETSATAPFPPPGNGGEPLMTTRAKWVFGAFITAAAVALILYLFRRGLWPNRP